ncbi:murein DD-endopeptidase MepM/ murein hydrolase activator NlpD [Paenibacillus phyllosphaerae]|uniref:Murein DD-endopeptidase MepM/ murein hydrolase activator NlpD n=1 Tax=Paenibacillus phyllosphaerae TaxID=274593 RepID=A0A7W5B5B8_9BACL|nr:murein DD-endopeptidase MepM/ murein hydrolase activator NlpD [Paenibacillus phyllosphaerae]
MKKGLATLAVVILAAFMFQPYSGYAASQVDKINKELEKVRQQMEAATQNRKQADTYKAYYEKQSVATKQTMDNILSQIDTVGTQLTGVQSQIDTTEEKLLKTGEELQEAEQRVASQDKLLQSRIRLMYTNGFVSYLDVLLSSTSFGDFLDRFDSLKSILGQDREILASHKEDKALVAEKKIQVEQTLGEVRTMYAKLEDYQGFLVDKEQEKEVLVASYEEKAEESEEISEEQEELLMQLAKKVADLEEQKRIASKKKKVTYYKGGKLAVPLQDSYRLSSNYGYRIHPITGKKKLHAGMDMAAPAGTPIYAAESGTVLVAQWWSGYGNAVIIDHGNGLWTVYGHIRNGGIKVEKGETVKRGQKIAEVGSTGQSTGNHLHFEVRLNGTPVEPSQYLK